ncbi:MAG: Tn3 family transposase [Halioglobus sp.]|nr:Tn3 family transposase [Halioglobus sp.]
MDNFERDFLSLIRRQYNTASEHGRLVHDDFRRELLRILDRGESTHRLLRAIHAGDSLAHRGRRPEELIAVSGSLTSLSNITIAWMTLHMQQVIDRWQREEGRGVDTPLLRQFRPAQSEGVNCRGKSDFPLHQYHERFLVDFNGIR